MSTAAESRYRRAERECRDPDELWEYLEAHKYEDSTLCIGWAIERASRYLNLDQSAIAQKTAVYDGTGHVIEPPITKSYVSAMLSGRSNVPPWTYKRLAKATEVNPIEFFIAEGWLDEADLSAYSTPDSVLALPILQKLLNLPPERRHRARAVVLSILDSIADINEPPTGVTNASAA